MTVADYECVITDVSKHLNSKSQATSGLFGAGARDQSTVELYRNILNIISNNEQIKEAWESQIAMGKSNSHGNWFYSLLVMPKPKFPNLELDFNK